MQLQNFGASCFSGAILVFSNINREFVLTEKRHMFMHGYFIELKVFNYLRENHILKKKFTESCVACIYQ